MLVPNENNVFDIVSQIVDDNEEYDNISLEYFLRDISNAKEKIPSQYEPILRITRDGGTTTAVYVGYMRPETEEEKKQREKKMLWHSQHEWDAF